MINKRIEKTRFLEMKENICILNEMVHSGDENNTIILKEGTTINENMFDEVLTFEIDILKKAVERFEKNTGLNIEIS